MKTNNKKWNILKQLLQEKNGTLNFNAITHFISYTTTHSSWTTTKKGVITCRVTGQLYSVFHSVFSPSMLETKMQTIKAIKLTSFHVFTQSSQFLAVFGKQFKHTIQFYMVLEFVSFSLNLNSILKSITKYQWYSKHVLDLI